MTSAEPDAAGRDESRTSLGVAALRAAHLLLDDPPPILDDPVSLRLLGDGAEARIRAGESRFRTPGSLALRSHVVLRSRFAEDQLRLAVERGVRQAVSLGAGLDTFPWRQPPWALDAPDLRLFEIDEPVTQAAKRRRLADANLSTPPNLTFAPVDLARVGLREALADTGVDLGRPVFVSWLGVMVYLPIEATRSVARALAGLAPGSELVLTFTSVAAGQSRLAAAADELGEPWRTTIDPEALVALLRESGFATAEVIDPAALGATYFAGRTDLPAPIRPSLAVAET